MTTNNVFIATLPRSGSTLLGLMLGSHSKICHVGETAYWAKMNPLKSTCCCGIYGCDKLIEIAQLILPYSDEINGVLDACGMIDSMEEPHKTRHEMSHFKKMPSEVSLEKALTMCVRGLNRMADTARTVFGKEIVVENSKYLLVAEELISRSSPWKVIVMTRDPRGVALSNKESGMRKNVPRTVLEKIPHLLSFALRANKIISSRNVLHVRYEDLCRQTIGTLNSICSFLEVEFEPCMLDFKSNRGHVLMGNRMIHDSNQEVKEDLRWKKMLSQEEKALFKRSDLILSYGSLGYDLSTDI